ncbi:MAG TPA: 2'-5' RNA ligase family protein [Xanthobacteraceae bacterium]|nr:2'-5' RNA ligase family protein [Xanthobacteraceae bacterium]
MRAQQSCFGFDAPAVDGLFFALFPDDAGAAALARTAQQLCIRHRIGARTIAPERLHVSLFGLGKHAGLPSGRIATLIEIAEAIAVSPFDVVFDRANSFAGRPRPLVLRGGEGMESLVAFQRRLGGAIQDRGLGRTKTPYTPHLTLMYDDRAIEEHAIEPVRWTVKEFVLVHSLLGRSRYIPLGRWPLRAPQPARKLSGDVDFRQRRSSFR